MKAHLAAVREFIAVLPESPDQKKALDALHRMEADAYAMPADPLGYKIACEASIKSLEGDVARLEESERYLLGACRRLQEQLAEARGMPRTTQRVAY